MAGNNLRGRAERALQRSWYMQPGLLSALLLPPSWVFAMLVGARRAAYRAGLLRTRRVNCPVIVVGNVTVGGTGKTPVVDWLAGELAALGHRPGIVSRGYGRRSRDVRPVRPDDRHAEAGDEALLLARRGAAAVCVGADRVAAARTLVAGGADVIIADDGLQHYRLHRDLEIAVIDGARGLGNGRLLPAGPLREPAARLSEVDIVIVNGPGELAGHQAELVPGDAVALRDGTRRPLAAFAGRPAWAVAGIGNPQRFTHLLESAGIEATSVPVADHATTDLAALERVHGWPILMTEKDAVKYDDCVSNAWYVPVTLRVSDVSRRVIMERILQLFSQVGHA